MSKSFHVGVTRDFLKPDGSLGFGDIGLDLLDHADGVEWEFLTENADELLPEQIARYDGLLVLAPRVTAATLQGVDRLKIIARFGVGYDSVDVTACTEAGVMLTITPDGVRRPVATSVMTFLLALSHRLFEKDRITRDGQWDQKLDLMGQGLTGKTLGVVGVGNIGKEVFRLAASFEMQHLGFDPHVDPETLTDLNVQLVELETLLTTADFVVVCCALIPQTRHLLDAARLALLKPSAYLINVARGPIIDQQALTRALVERQIAGAALDVFEKEPIDPDDPLLALDNVIVTPHGICWTDELCLGIGRDACQSLLDVAAGRVPQTVVNREVLNGPQLRARVS